MKRPLLQMALLSSAAGLLLFAAADSAYAHVCMDFPVSRVGPDCQRNAPQKIGPCGIEGRSEHVNVFRPGETITVEYRKTINHPSHHRVSFNPDGDEFYDPQAVDDISDDNPWVLVDGIFDDGTYQSVEITFPDIECDNCTLQLIQVMYDKLDNGFGGRDAEGGNDDLYYSCADIVLAGPSVNEPVDGDATDTALASSAGGSELSFAGGAAAQLVSHLSGHTDANAVGTGDAADRVFELRIYTTLPGMHDRLLQRFEDHTVRIFERHGIESVGYWVPQDPPHSQNTLIFLLAHRSRDAAVAAWETFTVDPEWQEVRDASMADGPLIDNVDRVWIDPTDFSALR